MCTILKPWLLCGGHADKHVEIIIIIVVVPVVVVAILVVLVLVLYKRARKSANKTMMGHIKAPQAPDTTLIITDIEGSTVSVGKCMA